MVLKVILIFTETRADSLFNTLTFYIQFGKVELSSIGRLQVKQESGYSKHNHVTKTNHRETYIEILIQQENYSPKTTGNYLQTIEL